MPRGHYGLRSIMCRGKVIILGCVQTDATTPNMVANIGSCCVRVGSGVQQLPTMLGPVVHLEPERYSSRKGYLLQDSEGQFHKTFTSVIYKCSF